MFYYLIKGILPGYSVLFRAMIAPSPSDESYNIAITISAPMSDSHLDTHLLELITDVNQPLSRTYSLSNLSHSAIKDVINEFFTDITMEYHKQLQKRGIDSTESDQLYKPAIQRDIIKKIVQFSKNYHNDEAHSNDPISKRIITFLLKATTKNSNEIPFKDPSAFTAYDPVNIGTPLAPALPMQEQNYFPYDNPYVLGGIVALAFLILYNRKAIIPSFILNFFNKKTHAPLEKTSSLSSLEKTSSLSSKEFKHQSQTQSSIKTSRKLKIDLLTDQAAPEKPEDQQDTDIEIEFLKADYQKEKSNLHALCNQYERKLENLRKICKKESNPFLEFKVNDQEHPYNIQKHVFDSTKFKLATHENSRIIREYVELVRTKLSSIDKEILKKTRKQQEVALEKKPWRRKEENSKKDVSLSKNQEKIIIKQIAFLEKKLQVLLENKPLEEKNPERIIPHSKVKKIIPPEHPHNPLFFNKNKNIKKRDIKEVMDLYHQLCAQLETLDLAKLERHESQELEAFLKYLTIRLALIIPLGIDNRYARYFRNNAFYHFMDKNVHIKELLKTLEEYINNIDFVNYGDSFCRKTNEFKSQILNDLLLPPSELLRGTRIEAEAFYQAAVKLASLQSTIDSSMLLNQSCKQFVEKSMNHTKVSFAKKSGFKIGYRPDEILPETIQRANAYRHLG